MQGINTIKPKAGETSRDKGNSDPGLQIRQTSEAKSET